MAKENPQFIHEKSLHNNKFEILSSENQAHLFRYQNNTDGYLQIMVEIRGQISRDRRMNCFFQQDHATLHASCRELAYLQACSSEDVMNMGPWPARSPDLYSCDLHFCGTPQPNIYYKNLHTHIPIWMRTSTHKLQSFVGRNSNP